MRKCCPFCGKGYYEECGLVVMTMCEGCGGLFRTYVPDNILAVVCEEEIL